MRISRTALVSAACSAATVLTVAFVASEHSATIIGGGPAVVGAARSGTAGSATDKPALDDVPGLGSSLAGLERDEVISYWEAWRRDTSISDCMAAAGFVWVPEVLYPSDDVVWVADILGVQPGEPQDDQVPPEDLNRGIEAGLSEADRDGYLQTLTGETAKDIDAFRESEAVPEGRDATTFAQGGCRGQAMASVGSIWNLERQLGSHLLTFRSDAQSSAAFGDVQEQYAACVKPFGVGEDVRGPGDLEALALKAPPDQADAFVEADRACLPIWQGGNEAAQIQLEDAFRAEHQQALATQQDKYEDAIARLSADQEFLAFVQQRAAR